MRSPLLSFLFLTTASGLGLTARAQTASLSGVIKFQTSTYSAEFGGAPGGQLQIVTRSGSSAFHGDVFDYFRNDALDANDWFANAYGLPRSPLRQHDFGGDFGGPLFKNRTFFLLSYEGLRLRLPQFQESQVPSLRARQMATGAIQQAFAIPNSPADPTTIALQDRVSGDACATSAAESGWKDHRIVLESL